MSKSNNIVCVPLKDTEKRFLLGKEGKTAELLAIGVNPNTANEESLDPTAQNIETIAHNNSCDGWWLINLYPLRTPKPELLPKVEDADLTKLNLSVIEEFLQENKRIKKVLCCWGDNVDYFSYLSGNAQKIIGLINSFSVPVYCLAKTARKNPYHAGPRAVNRYLGGVNNVELKEYSL